MTPVYRRLAVLLLLISTVYCDNVIPQNTLESQLLLLFKRWRAGGVDTGIIPLPSLRCLKIPDVKHSYDRKGIKMTYILNKLELTGLDSFLIKELKALEAKKSLGMSISLNIPKMTLYAENYDLKGLAYHMYPLKGAGNMTVVFRDIDLNFNIYFFTTEDEISTRIGDFRFDFNIHRLEANLVNSSWPINKVLNSEGVEILASYQEKIVQAMWDYVVPYVNRNLVNVTTVQIVNTILATNLQ